MKNTNTPHSAIRKTIAAALIATAAMLPLAACSVSAAPTTSTVPTSSAPAKDDVFIATLRKQGFPTVDPTEAVDTAVAVCDALDSGVPAKDIANVALEQFSPTDAGTFLGAAVNTYCPEHFSKFENLGTGQA